MDANLTAALKRNGLLDDEDYLLPPEHESVTLFVKRLFQLAEIQQKGIKLTKQDSARLKEMQMVFDYYEEVLEEEANALENSEADSDSEADDDADDDNSDAEDYSE